MTDPDITMDLRPLLSQLNGGRSGKKPGEEAPHSPVLQTGILKN